MWKRMEKNDAINNTLLSQIITYGLHVDNNNEWKERDGNNHKSSVNKWDKGGQNNEWKHSDKIWQ